MLHGRKRATLALTAAATIVCVALAPMSPSSAKPDIDTVKVKVDRLYEKAEHAQERLNDAQVRLTEVNKELAALRQDQARQQARLNVVRAQVAGSVVEQYKGQGVSAVGQVVVSEDPSAFLEQLTTMSEYNDLQSAMFGDYAKELKALKIRREETRRRQDRAETLQRQLKAEKATVEKNYSAAKAVLGDLEAKQRAEFEEASRSGDISRLPDVEASGQAAAAVDYAMAQVGKAYVFGAAGPDAFDCSGLTMMAWAQAGVALPHSSSAQFSSGPRIAEADLQPGDLVFYYSPISHVAMYIGNGLIVGAQNPSDGVKVVGLHSMPYVGAVRPG